MPRDLSAVASEVAKKLGTEPIIIIEVDWSNSSSIAGYADKKVGEYPGKILNISGMDAINKIGATGTSVDVSITLDDTDGSIKNIIDTVDVHKSRVQVYQAFEALGPSKSLLVDGVIETPIVYSDAERSISFTVVSKVEDSEVGFSAEEEDVPCINPQAIGTPWPMAFGEVIRVPALKLTDQARGVCQTNYGAVSLANLDDLCSRTKSMWDQDLAKQKADTNPRFSDSNYAIIIDNLTNATIAMNTLFGQLVTDSPTQEGDLLAFIDACLNLYKNELNKVLFGQIGVDLNVQIAGLEGPDGSIEAAKASNLQAINANILDPSGLGAAQVISTQETVNDLEDELRDAERDKLINTANLLTANSNITIFTAQKKSLTLAIAVIVVNPIIVQDGRCFPEGEINININGLIYRGSFAGEVFTVTEANLSADTGVAGGGRLNSNTNEFWIADPTINLKGKYCFFAEGIMFVDAQDQTRCFGSPILYSLTGHQPPLTEGSEPREIWDPVLLGGSFSESSVFIRPGWISSLESNSSPDFADGRSTMTIQDYAISVGDDVYLAEQNEDVYIANLLPSAEVLEVMAYRVIDGVRKLRPVPSQYYTVTLKDDLLGQTPTTIRMHRPLVQYVGENWEPDIFVTLRETAVGSNTVDIIEYLVTTYTDMAFDDTNGVTAALASYPSNFALLTRPDALSLIADIAWQARCVTYVRYDTAAKKDTVYIKYLAKSGAPVATIAASQIVFETLELTMSETQDLVTKVTAEWVYDYTVEEPNRVVLRNNIPKYGKIEEVYDFFIYNIETLIIKSATFWLIRYSNTWKKVKFSAFLNTLELETLDDVALTLPDNFASNGSTPGMIESANYDSASNRIEYEVLTEVRSGEMEVYDLARPADSSESFPTDEFPGVSS